MKKILKAITFIFLVKCLMLNTNFVYATKDPRCPRDAKSNYYESWKNAQGTDGETDYYSHDILQYWLDEENNGKNWKITSIAAIAGVIGGAAGAAMGSVIPVVGTAAVSSAGTILSSSLATIIVASWKSHNKEWVESSMLHDYCGVKVKYWRDPIGGWHYMGFEPQ